MTAFLKREPDFNQFLKVLWRRGRPDYLPFYEHVASAGFIARRTETAFDQMSPNDPPYWQTYVDFWLGMGYDCIPMERGLRCPLPSRQGGLSRGSEEFACIFSREDFERYPWPPESNAIDFESFERVSELLPAGVKIVGGVAAGPYEWAAMMLGTVGMAYLLADDPELVEMVFRRLGSLHIASVRRLAAMDSVGALRQGDDLGFKTSTFLPPEQLRRLVFPIYGEMAAAAHAHGKPFILHSCGNLDAVYEDIIACGVDAKHSFEDVILPVGEFKRRHGQRITPLGGLDVDFLCRATEAEIRACTRRHIDQCFADGWWALGTGNSLTNYMPVENYITALDEGAQYAR